ncbi:MAG: hypothetical protein ACAI44_11840 [Candidatus Sericytochromatia bacterium]
MIRLLSLLLLLTACAQSPLATTLPQRAHTDGPVLTAPAEDPALNAGLPELELDSAADRLRRGTLSSGGYISAHVQLLKTVDEAAEPVLAGTPTLLIYLADSGEATLQISGLYYLTKPLKLDKAASRQLLQLARNYTAYASQLESILN